MSIVPVDKGVGSLGLANTPSERYCVGFGCNAAIHACMGFVKAGDFVEAAFEKTRCPACVRELCGRCVMKVYWLRYGVMAQASALR